MSLHIHEYAITTCKFNLNSQDPYKQITHISDGAYRLRLHTIRFLSPFLQLK
jgi:hypothetical protein